MSLFAALGRYFRDIHQFHDYAQAHFYSYPSLLIVALILLSFRAALITATLSLSSIPDSNSAVRHLFRHRSLTSSSSRQPPPPPPSALRFLPIAYLIQFGHDDRVLLKLPFSPAPSESAAFNDSRNALFITADGDMEFRNFSNPIEVSLPPIPSMPSLPDDQDQAPDLGIQELRSNSSGSQDLAASAYLILILFCTQIFAVAVFVLAYASALGIVFLTIMSSYISSPISVFKTIHYGFLLGMHRLKGFVFLRWLARDVVIQLLRCRFFPHPRTQNMLFELLVKVKFMSFFISPANPWPAPHDESLSVFFFVWPLVDATMSLIVAVLPWVLMMRHDLPGRYGFFLVTRAPAGAITIKVLETLVYWSLGRWAATETGFITAAVLSLAEVYFMVVWVAFYISTRVNHQTFTGWLLLKTLAEGLWQEVLPWSTQAICPSRTSFLLIPLLLYAMFSKVCQ